MSHAGKPIEELSEEGQLPLVNFPIAEADGARRDLVRAVECEERLRRHVAPVLERPQLGRINACSDQVVAAP